MRLFCCCCLLKYVFRFGYYKLTYYSSHAIERHVFPCLENKIYAKQILPLGTFFYILTDKHFYVIQRMASCRRHALSTIHKPSIYVYSKKHKILLVTNVPVVRIEVRNCLGFRVARLYVPELIFRIQSMTIQNSYIYVTNHVNQLYVGFIEDNYHVRMKYITNIYKRLKLKRKSFLLHDICCTDGKCSGNYIFQLKNYKFTYYVLHECISYIIYQIIYCMILLISLG